MAKSPKKKRTKKYNHIAATDRRMNSEIKRMLGNVYFYATSVSPVRVVGLTGANFTVEKKFRDALIRETLQYLADKPSTWRVRVDLFHKNDKGGEMETAIVTLDETSLLDFTNGLDTVIRYGFPNYEQADGWAVLFTESPLLEIGDEDPDRDDSFFNAYTNREVYTSDTKLTGEQAQRSLQELKDAAIQQVYRVSTETKLDAYVKVENEQNDTEGNLQPHL